MPATSAVFLVEVTGTPSVVGAMAGGRDAVLAHRDAELVLLEAGRDIRMRLRIDVGVIILPTLGEEKVVADLIRQGEIAVIINTPLGRTSHYD